MYNLQCSVIKLESSLIQLKSSLIRLIRLLNGKNVGTRELCDSIRELSNSFEEKLNKRALLFN